SVGEKLGLSSWDSVSRNGVGWGAPDNDTAKIPALRARPPPMKKPFRGQSVGVKLRVSKSRSSFDASRAFEYTPGAVGLFDRYAIRVPSGAQTGAQFSLGPNVNFEEPG